MRQQLPGPSRSFSRTYVFGQAAGMGLRGTETALGGALLAVAGTAAVALGAPVEVPVAASVLAVVADGLAIRYIGKAVALVWRASQLDC
jgi:hypothetical protein